MGLGNTAKKLQTVADTAEKLYTRINELREQLQKLRQKVDETSQQVDETNRQVNHIEHEVRSQRALLVALAENEGIDAEAVLAESAIEEAEPASTTATVDGDGDDATETTGSDPTDETVSDTGTTGAATNDDGTAVTSESDG